MNSFQKRAWLLAALYGFLGSESATAASASPAVEVDPGGSGQVLLSPIWTTTAGHLSLINIQAFHETRFTRRIAKLRLLDGDGETVFSGNLYFHNSYDSWVASILPRAGGGSRLLSNDETCLLVEGEQGVEPFSGSIDIEADFGSAEVIVMGTDWRVPGDFVWPRASHEEKCEQLAEKWNEGDWQEAPETGVRMHAMYQLRAEWMIVHVQRGTLFQVPGVAIDGYSDRVQHTRPGDPLPDLASGHGAETDEGINRSRTCSDGLCREDVWPTPLDAMAAALMLDHFRASYNISPNTAAATDLVVHYPLLKYYAERNGVEHIFGHSHIKMDTRDRAGNFRTPIICVGNPVPCYDTYWAAPLALEDRDPVTGGFPRLILPAPFITVSLNPAEALIAPSAVLGLPGAYRVDFPPFEHPDGTTITLPPLPNEGSFHARPNELALNYGETMQGADGFRYRGSPVIPVVFQQYVNGVLAAPDGTLQRANYGTAFAPSSWAWPIGWDNSED